METGVQHRLKTLELASAYKFPSQETKRHYCLTAGEPLCYMDLRLNNRKRKTKKIYSYCDWSCTGFLTFVVILFILLTITHEMFLHFCRSSELEVQMLVMTPPPQQKLGTMGVGLILQAGCHPEKKQLFSTHPAKPTPRRIQTFRELD